MWNQKECSTSSARRVCRRRTCRSWIDRFLQTFKDQPHENLRLKLLAKLLADEIKLKQAKNATKARTFSEMLIAT